MKAQDVKLLKKAAGSAGVKHGFLGHESLLTFFCLDMDEENLEDTLLPSILFQWDAGQIMKFKIEVD